MGATVPDLDDNRPVPCEEAVAYLELWRTKPPSWERDIAERREEALVEAAAAGGPPEPVTSVEPLLVDGVPARLYRPLGGERDVLVWLHGSAWMIGDLDFCDPVVRRLTNRARCAVLSVDYRLAPEHPFPAAIEDAWAATAWASERFRQVAVGGDSAGGNLARRRSRFAPVTAASSSRSRCSSIRCSTTPPSRARPTRRTGSGIRGSRATRGSVPGTPTASVTSGRCTSRTRRSG